MMTSSELLSNRDMEELESNNTDTSEDSVEVRVRPISGPIVNINNNKTNTSPTKRNKRKSLEPKRVLIVNENDDKKNTSPSIPSCESRLKSMDEATPIAPPPKKRFKHLMMTPTTTTTPTDSSSPVDLSASPKTTSSSSPFRPWDLPSASSSPPLIPTKKYPIFPNLTSKYPEPEQEEPLALIKKISKELNRDSKVVEIPSIHSTPSTPSSPPTLIDNKGGLQNSSSEDISPPPSTSSNGGRAKQRNYKNMTRERRVEANARERQRVHTITNAFEALQNAIPSEETGQKLSKLSIIKIATSYIMVLSRMAGHDYTVDKSAPSVEECIKNCQQLIEAESKLRKK